MGYGMKLYGISGSMGLLMVPSPLAETWQHGLEETDQFYAYGAHRVPWFTQSKALAEAKAKELKEEGEPDRFYVFELEIPLAHCITT